jgi:Family of unknown function (DUF6112)
MNRITTRSLAATPAQAGVVNVPPPSPDFLPGSTQLSNLVAGVEYLALVVLVATMAWFAVEWAIAHHTNNPYHTQSGKVGFLRAAGAAILVGSASALVDYFWRVGGQIR